MSGPDRVVAFEHVNVAAQIRAAVARLREDGHRVDVVVQRGGEPPIPLAARDASVILASTNLPLPQAELAAFERLRGVVFIASGTNSIDLDAATARGIVVAHSPVAENSESIAEATIMLMLASLYQLDRSQQLLRDGWQRPPEPYARMLQGKTVGLVGFGAIARGVARRLASWNVRIVYAARNEAPDTDLRRVPLDELITVSDVVSVHVPLTPETRDLIDAAQLRRFRTGAVLINTSRGGIVDEAALAEALKSRRLGAAAIDTFAAEPIAADNPLLHAPNVILTPHIVGHSVEANVAIVTAAVDNVEAILAGRRPRYVKNPAVLEAI